MYQAGPIARCFLADIDQQVARFATQCSPDDARLIHDFLRPGAGQQRISVLEDLRRQLAKAASRP